MNEELYDQWLRYRKEIAYILHYGDLKVVTRKNCSTPLKDFFSEITQKEMEDRLPFEGVEHE
jgi:hypothetical protein